MMLKEIVRLEIQSQRLTESPYFNLGFYGFRVRQ